MKFYEICSSSQLTQGLLLLLFSISVYCTLYMYYVFGYAVDTMLPRRNSQRKSIGARYSSILPTTSKTSKKGKKKKKKK
ncbi:hypothetical protein IWW34DRAFT_719466, partial [Fusarium oxysporum f. sp. albedinis]